MQFAGFTPQQQYILLQKAGYTGSPQEDEMGQAIEANPNLAMALGRYAEAAQKRIDRALGKQTGYAEGGTVQGTTLNDWWNGTTTTNNDATSNTGTETPVTGGTQEQLDSAQQAYADALASGDGDAIQSAQQQLTLAQQAFQVASVPSVDETMATGINDPMSMVTQQDVTTISPTNDQLIAAGTGQQTSTPTATATQVQTPQLATQTDATATQATAAPTTAANTYEATTLGDQVEGTLEGLEAATADPTEAATVQGQLASLMQDFEDGTPPWASGAMREATALMQRRGLGASSMAGEAIVLAAMQAALPIASQDAQTFAQFELQNLSNRQQTTIFKTQQRIAGLFSDQAAENAAKQFNAASKNQTDQFFAGLETTVSQFNAAQVNAIAQFNAEQQNMTSRFNVEQATTVDMFNAKQQDAISMFNAQIQQQRDQFNAENDLVIAQANTQWMQQISTINTAAENLANRDAAQTANALTQRQIDHLHQYERDIMSFAWQSAESAEDRNLRLLLADKDLAYSREQMDAERDASMAYSLAKIFF